VHEDELAGDSDGQVPRIMNEESRSTNLATHD
jgi:hypothetical protein